MRARQIMTTFMVTGILVQKVSLLSCFLSSIKREYYRKNTETFKVTYLIWPDQTEESSSSGWSWNYFFLCIKTVLILSHITYIEITPGSDLWVYVKPSVSLSVNQTNPMCVQLPSWYSFLTSSPFSELLRVLLHALVLSKLHQLACGSAHVDGGGPGWGQVTQRLPDEGHRVITPGTCPQLHGQAEAADDGDGRGASHLEEKGSASDQHHSTSWSSSLASVPTSSISPRFNEGY